MIYDWPDLDVWTDFLSIRAVVACFGTRANPYLVISLSVEKFKKLFFLKYHFTYQRFQCLFCVMKNKTLLHVIILISQNAFAHVF